MDNKVKIGLKVSRITMMGNVFLAIIKVAIGFIAKSNAMIADGIHSLSDVLSTFAVILGLKFSSKPDDEDHPYGHEKIESLTAIFLAVMLFAVAIGIGYSGIKQIILKSYSIPGILAAWAAIISIAFKEWMYRYTIKYAKIINSTSMEADAWHHRSDSLSSIGALVGIVGARMGMPILDSLAALIICVIIIKVAYDILKQSIGQIIDKSANFNEVEEIKNKILSVDGVKNIDNIKTRIHANKIYVDVEISVNYNLTVEEGHSIAADVHDLVEEDKNVKHCMVHVNPFK